MTPDAGLQDRFTPSMRQAVAHAKQLVRKHRHSHVTPEHILLGLLELDDEAVLRAVDEAVADRETIRLLVEHHTRDGEHDIPEDALALSERAKRAVESAREEAVRQKSAQIGPAHLLLGLVRVRNTVASAVLHAVDLNEERLRQVLGLEAPQS